MGNDAAALITALIDGSKAFTLVVQPARKWENIEDADESRGST